TPDGGSIKVLFNKDEKKIKIVVEDSGVGIENSEIDRIFDRFYAGSNSMHHQSGKFEFNSRGTGLGLAIVKSYIEAHKGTIWAESEGNGKGSRFYILLPLEAGE
ncbi:MAG: ATP-binding protein, partial [Blastocatellia bacterium]|nr:ATP-binding protein [Blastocatellia bacterium]